MKDDQFKPHHMNACHADFEGNNGIGRYVFLPGSDGRAQQFGECFENLTVKKHPRCHNLYMGTIKGLDGKNIDVAAIATGMGCPSVDIIVNELIKLGAKRFLRVGTCGSVQPEFIRAGSVVVATASVRDEGTSRHYAPIEVPAVASLDFVNASINAAKRLALKNVYEGIIHSKDSLFAREFGCGPLAEHNHQYMDLLKKNHVIASEMEASHLFILCNMYDREARIKYHDDIKERIFAGTVLAVIGDDRPFVEQEIAQQAETNAVNLAFETIKELAKKEM